MASATSPYLRQHASNPVDWYPWGEEALRTARETDRPILLSVGYSACHWCHVMAHECFEDPGIAALMNSLYVCIKVDREERPDIDSVYMRAVQAMTGQGGWPMTVFLTPEGAPYFGGTYFPPASRRGLPGFPTVLQAAHEAYRSHRDDVDHAGAELARALSPPSLPPPGEPTSGIVERATRRLLEQADRRDGGFGGAPKFPHPAALELLLRRGLVPGGAEASAEDAEAAAVARTSLSAMSRGGIFDQLGGGFHRYSVDARWLVPHFEKMLYDSAQLAVVYLHAWQLTGDREMRRVTEMTLDWMLREMLLPDGGFAASLDADSEGEEGRYYVWTPGQVAAALGSEEDARLACVAFGVTGAGSFDAGSSVLIRRADVMGVEGTPAGAWSPGEPSPRSRTGVEGAGAGGLREGVAPQGARDTEEEPDGRLERIRRRLLQARCRRVPPARDAKVVTAWNALAIRAFAEAGAALGREDHVEVARRCAERLARAARADGRLRRTWSEGVGGAPAVLEDVAGLGDALLALYEATGDPAWHAYAVSLAEEALEQFRDPGGAGYFDTASDAEPLWLRPQSLEDSPTPAGQTHAAQLFARLAGYTGESIWRERALEVVGPLREAIARAPLALGSLACVADQLVAPSREVAITGAPGDPGTRALLAEVWRRRDPYRVLAWGGEGSVPLLAGRGGVEASPTAYVCEGFICRAPAASAAELAAQLDAPRASDRQ